MSTAEDVIGDLLDGSGNDGPTAEVFAARLRVWLSEHEDDLAPFRSESTAPIAEALEHERRLHRLLADSGWTRWGWPVQCGGLGGSAALRGVLADEVYAAGYYLPEAFTLLGVVGPALVEFAPALAAQHLPKALTGEEWWCQGFSEPDAGTDLAAIRTRADETSDGFRVNGQKVWASSGHLASWCLLLARTGVAESGHRGLSLLWVDMRSSGVSARPIACANDREELSEIFFDDVIVPRDHVVGELGGGWSAAMYLLQYERGNYGWQRQGWMHARLTDAVTTANDRSSPAAAALGDAYLTLVALRATTRRTLRALADGEQLGPQISVDKLLLSTAEQAVLDTARILLWPNLEVDDSDAARGWRRDWFYTRAASIYGGAAEVQRDILAQRVGGLPRGA